VFIEPFEEFFDPEIGRPSIPMETYLRMMFLCFRYRLGFETVCAEVADSLAWRRFCRIGLTDAVPHPTALMKITTRCGEKVVAQLNEALIAKATAAKLVRLSTRSGRTPPRRRGERGLSLRRRAAGQGRGHAGQVGREVEGCRLRLAHRLQGPHALGQVPVPRHRGVAASPAQ
jgi:IS5 family transposase